MVALIWNQLSSFNDSLVSSIHWDVMRRRCLYVGWVRRNSHLPCRFVEPTWKCNQCTSCVWDISDIWSRRWAKVMSHQKWSQTSVMCTKGLIPCRCNLTTFSTRQTLPQTTTTINNKTKRKQNVCFKALLASAVIPDVSWPNERESRRYNACTTATAKYLNALTPLALCLWDMQVRTKRN